MAGREEALERARLGMLRNKLNADRYDNTLFREAADSAFLGVYPSGIGRTTLDEKEQERRAQALSAATTGLVAAPLAFVAGEGIKASVPGTPLAEGERLRAMQQMVPGLDPSFYTRDGSIGRLTDSANLNEDWRGRSLQKSLSYAPGGYSTERDLSSGVREIDWARTAENLGTRTPDRVASVSKAPGVGPDLGGFSRGWDGPSDGNRVSYTVVPNANSGRFAQRLAPAVLDQVYRKDIALRDGGTDIPDDLFIDLGPKPVEGPVRPVPKDRLADLSGGERLRLMEQMLPGQLAERNQSGYIWGTQYSHPRYEYGKGADARNPEVVVSEVRTPPELETKYLFTQDARDPFVQYKGSTGERGLGPSWGVSEMQAMSQAPIAGRRRRQTDGDISFRSDLIERRGGFSLADAQAVQGNLGIPVTGAFGEKGPSQALEEAVESIRVKEGLNSHADVIEKYARRLPVMGRTTAPRQPASVTTSQFRLDTDVAIPEGMKRRFDVGAALSEAGLEPTVGGVKRANQLVNETALRRLGRYNRAIGLAPAAGVALNLADPQAAELLGAAVREKNPTVRSGLAADAFRVYGQNAVVGGAQGALVSGALAAAPRLGFGAAAAPIATGLTVAAPAMAMVGVGQAADAYLKGATGEGLAKHTQKVQAKSGSRNAGQVIPQIVPTPKAVVARTPSGTAKLQPYKPPSNPLSSAGREAKNRLRLATERFNPLRGEFGLTELLFGR